MTLQVKMQPSNFLNVKNGFFFFFLGGGEGFVKGFIFKFLPIFNPPTLS